MLKDGYYKSLPLKDYLSEDALSKGALSDLSVSAAHYKARREHPPTFAAANLGSKNTNAYRDWLSTLPADALVLSADEMSAACFMRDAVLAHPVASDLLSGGNSEVSMFWSDANGVRRKCRPDYLAEAYVDLKTAFSAKPDVFGKQAFNLHYHWSAAWTIDVGAGLGSTLSQYYFVAIEKEPPWAVCVFSTPDELLEMARAEIAPVYHLYKTCKEYDTWPSYTQDVEPLTFPRWAMKKIE